MKLYGLKPAHVAGFSFLCLIAAAVLLYRHDGPYWLMVLLFAAVGWSNGRWREAGRGGAVGLSTGAFLVMLLAPFVSVAALVWGVVLAL